MHTFWKSFFYVTFGLFFFTFTNANAITPIVNEIPIHEAFISKFTYPNLPTIVAKSPPQRLLENIPPRPAIGLIWIPGYWAWIEEKNEYAWICGIWRRPPPKFFWIPGTWNDYQGGWAWSKGFWSPVPLENLYYINKAPPNAIDDKVPEAPGKDAFWAPGYWEYSIEEQSYSWLVGKWEPFHEKWVLTPASYIWSPSGYIYAPMHWDQSLDSRGFSYACSNAVKLIPVLVEPIIIIQQLYCYYPDYLTFYWHCWHYHQDWWDDCICIPSWWAWTEWWTFSWGDCWGFWWWWSHPGFLPPEWLSLELSMQIAPPPLNIIKLFENIKKPIFEYKPGKKALLPEGIPGFKHPHKPHIPSGVTPKDSILIPPLPIQPPKQITTPPTPSIPPTQPHYQPRETPPSIYYPSDEFQEPPRYYSPDRPHRPRYPPREPPREPQRPQQREPQREPQKEPQRPPQKPPQKQPQHDYDPSDSNRIPDYRIPIGRYPRPENASSWQYQKSKRETTTQ